MKYAGLLASVVFLAASCGSKPESAAAPAAKQEAKAPEYFKVDPATASNITGSVKFAGKPPAPKKISMDAEAECQKLNTIPVLDKAVEVSSGGKLANVFVYVKSGLEGKTFEPPTEAVVLEQKGCQFVPRVMGLRAGQILDVRNSDPVTHNVHPMPRNNRDWNQSQAPGAPDLKRKFAVPEVMIPVKCNVHAWMKGYIAVLDHPFFAISTKDGEFSLKGLPPGQYTIAAWHESFGEKTEQVTLPLTKPLEFVYQ